MEHNLFSIIPYKEQLIKLDKAKKAVAFYQHYRIDLLTGEKKAYNFNNWILENQEVLLSSKEEPLRVVHLFYELSFLIEKEFNFLKSESLLVVDIQFESYNFFTPGTCSKINLKKERSPIYADYRKLFNKGYQELLNGNCYQFNLTNPYIYSFNKELTPEDFIFSLWKKKSSRGAYGSATYIPYFKKLFLSNSPECLFQYKGNNLSTMPIKGTLKCGDPKNYDHLWKMLSNDKKSQAELYMISDLLRNDLSRIELPKARVVKKKSPKLVPGLLHQYSQIDVKLSDNISLWKVIENIFPGGSITGAPKKRAMRLIYSLEKRERGFYCGSTMIIFKEMKSASINIRSSTIDFNAHHLLYQAGGGITLLSKAKAEFNEMTYKHDSFLEALTP